MSPGNDERATSVTTKVKFEVIPKTLLSPFKEHFPGYTEGLVRGQPDGFVLTPAYARHADELISFQPRSDDVWIVTFPKCGTYSLFFSKHEFQDESNSKLLFRNYMDTGIGMDGDERMRRGSWKTTLDDTIPFPRVHLSLSNIMCPFITPNF